MKKIFVLLIQLNILICSWIPYFYIVFFHLKEYENSRTTFFQDLLFYIPYLLSLTLGIGSVLFVKNIKDHKWAEYIFTKDYFENKAREEQENRIIQKQLVDELAQKKFEEYKRNTKKE